MFIYQYYFNFTHRIQCVCNLCLIFRKTGQVTHSRSNEDNLKKKNWEFRFRFFYSKIKNFMNKNGTVWHLSYNLTLVLLCTFLTNSGLNIIISLLLERMWLLLLPFFYQSFDSRLTFLRLLRYYHRVMLCRAVVVAPYRHLCFYVHSAQIMRSIEAIPKRLCILSRAFCSNAVDEYVHRKEQLACKMRNARKLWRVNRYIVSWLRFLFLHFSLLVSHSFSLAVFFQLKQIVSYWKLTCILNIVSSKS